MITIQCAGLDTTDTMTVEPAVGYENELFVTIAESDEDASIILNRETATKLAHAMLDFYGEGSHIKSKFSGTLL